MTDRQPPPSFPPRVAGGKNDDDSPRTAGGKDNANSSRAAREKNCLLALETSGRTASFAVLEDDRLICEVLTNLSVQQKDSFPLWISQWLNDIGMPMERLTGVAVSMGPGSFTGLRVGMSLAKGICLAQNIPLWAVPTLQAMAQALPPTDWVLCPTTIARSGECYAALYSNSSGELQELEPPFVADARTLVEHLSADILHGEDTSQHDHAKGLSDRLTGPAWIWGEGAWAMQHDLESLLGEDQHIEHGDLFMPRASAIARLAQIQIARGDIPATPNLEPFYLKSFPG
jgi:tRNA threonylcarbamoyladenosine biosynthesis protein TsaB